MPTLAVKRDELFAHLGRSYTDDEFDELCFEFGVELDEITSERDEAVKGGTKKLSKKELAALDSSIVYKIDVPANRYDLLCIEGLVRALRVFLGEMDAPVYTLTTPTETPQQIMTVKTANTDTIRPFVVCATLREITFTPERYQSFIELQDQLHRNLCRNRTLVAIGTHDLDSVTGPFTYDAEKPEEIKFVPLTDGGSDDDGGSREYDARELLQHYSTDPSCKHLKPYVGIIQRSPLYPVIRDADGVVLSLPPIINGSHSKISLQTKNVFVECTATDLTKANIVLDTVVCMFSEYCAVPYSVEPVKVIYEGAPERNYTTPKLEVRRERADVDFVNSLIGVRLDAGEMVKLCEKVQLGPARLIVVDDADGGDRREVLEVTVPPTRSDILHAVDVAEDVGIAYGYNNIKKRVPQTCTVGGEQPLNLLGDLLREEISRAGYTEVLTHGLSSIHDNFTALRRPVTAAVSLSNPANVEYQVVRTTLLPGLLKTLQHNKSASFSKGFKLFEISDVVLPDDEYVSCESVVGARNSRRVCAVYAGPTSGFEVIHGLVDRIMTLTEVCPEEMYVKNSAKGDDEKYRVAREGWYYTIRGDDSNQSASGGGGGTYFPGRSAAILLKRPNNNHGSAQEEGWVEIGSFGILHPEVLKNFDIQYPASSIELDLEALL